MWKFILGNRLRLAGIGLILAGIGSFWLYVTVLQKNLAQAELGLVKAELVNSTNVANISRIKGLLDSAVTINQRNERNAADIVEKLNKELERANTDVQKDIKEVKKTLSNEECSSVVIPSDTEALLRNALQRANSE